jgi:hypothetical protein
VFALSLMFIATPSMAQCMETSEQTMQQAVQAEAVLERKFQNEDVAKFIRATNGPEALTISDKLFIFSHPDVPDRFLLVFYQDNCVIYSTPLAKPMVERGIGQIANNNAQ